jgi:predicted enzyme related to lactoylglutathione lyase
MLKNCPAHTLLAVADLNRARRFYEHTLGLTPLSLEAPASATAFEAGNGTVIVLYQKPDGSPADHTVLGFIVPDLERIIQELADRGVDLDREELPGPSDEQGIVDFGWARSAWIRDSEGNSLVLNQVKDPDRAPWIHRDSPDKTTPDL